jgi:hypothetical protein
VISIYGNDGAVVEVVYAGGVDRTTTTERRDRDFDCATATLGGGGGRRHMKSSPVFATPVSAGQNSATTDLTPTMFGVEGL